MLRISEEFSTVINEFEHNFRVFILPYGKDSVLQVRYGGC